MTDWTQLLAQHSGADAPLPSTTDNFVAALSDLSLIAFTGEDAAKFLHNQLTNDVEHLGLDEARLAGYCSPKGRLLATMLMWRSADSILLEIARELQPALQKRLQMFVMRAKTTAVDMGEDAVILGFGGDEAATVLREWFPNLPAAQLGKVDGSAGTLIRVGDAAGQPRYQWITTPATAVSVWPTLISNLKVVDTTHWRRTEISAGIPHITLATQEKFVPQMVNLEAIGGVNFKKGCYPGQEIVARSQYLGKLKRRMLPASVTATEVVPGMEVFAAHETEQPCGMIVNAARDAGGVTRCLVEIKTAILESATIHLGPNGPQLTFSALPYALPDTV